MRVEFEDTELERLAGDGDAITKRWPSEVTKTYRRRIQQLCAVQSEQDLRSLRSLHLEKLKGNRAGTSSIRINDRYRLVLKFKTVEAERIVIVVDGCDYHG